jgi:hypothetical protein
VIALTDAAHSLELTTDAAVALDWSVTYFRTASLIAEGVSSDQGNVAAAGTVTIIAAPAAGKEYKLALLTAVNKDAVLPLTVALNKRAGASAYRLIAAVLSPGDQIYYVDGANAPVVMTASGRIKHDNAGLGGGGGGSVASFLHTQASASASWTVPHNLNKQALHVEVTTTGGAVILTPDIVPVSLDVLTISFDVAFAGFARVSG